jgi:hypothetical protein
MTPARRSSSPTTSRTPAARSGWCFDAAYVAQARCAVLYEEPQSIVKCEYIWTRTEKWVDFP